MDTNIQKFEILSFAKKDLPNYGEIYHVEAISSDISYVQKSLDEDCITDEFHLTKSGSLAKEARQAYEGGKTWVVDMSKFQSKDDVPDINGHIGSRTIHDELVEMNEEEFSAMLEKTLREMDQSELKEMVDKAIRKNVLAQMGLEGCENWKTWRVVATTLKDGYVYENHLFDNLLANDEKDAYNVMLSSISTKERRPIRPTDILSYLILPNDRNPFDFDSIMAT